MFIIIFVWPILVRVKCSKISQTKSPTDENFSPTQLETTTALVCYFLPNVRHFLSKAYSDYNNFVHSSIKVHREKWQRLVLPPNEFNILRKIRKIRRKPITLEKFVLIRDRWIYIWKRMDSSILRFLNVLVLFLFTFHLLLFESIPFVKYLQLVQIEMSYIVSAMYTSFLHFHLHFDWSLLIGSPLTKQKRTCFDWT